MFYSFILLITILSYINSIYISPYKNNDFNIEIPYANHSKQNINLIFSVSEREIPSGVYFTINFQNLSNFENDDAGTLSKCKLEPYYDYDGDNFNPSSDLIASQSEEYINYISLCTVNGYTYNFKLNHSILIDTPYELSFKMSSAFGNQGKGFLNFFSVSFESSPSSNTSFIYSKNWFFAQFGVRDPISASQNVSLTRKKNYYDKDFFNSINNCLNDSLLSYEEAVSKLSDIGVYSFNEMIRTSNILKFATWDIRSYPNDIIEYPGFLGNFMLEVYVDTDLKSFTLFRIDIPTGWSIENSNCVSLNFTKIFANGTNKKVNSISHSKCKIGEDSQSLTFYNIEPIMKNTYIRINITNVKNPYIPMTGMSKLLIFDENTKIMKIESNELGLLKVATKKNLNITIRNAISNLIPNTTSFLLNTTQQIQMELTLEYYDISAESKIVITQNSSDNSKFGFNEGSCVIVNENWALGTYPLKPILCVVDKSQNTLTINNIAFITADTPFKIFFINSNEEIITQVQFQAEIFVKKLDDSDFSNVASVSNFHNIKMEKKSISLTSVYYEFDNGTKALNLEELPLEQTKLKFEFTMPSIQYSNGNSDYLEIIMNEWINADLQNLLCFVTVNAATNNASCNYTNFDNSAVVSVLLDQYNIFTNTSITLEIQGLSYQRILFNAYKYSFDYYLIYYSKNTNYISVFSANIKPILNENPESSQILIIGQGGNATVTTSIIKIKLSSPNYSYFTNLFRSNSKISIFFKNLQSDQMKNYANCSCFYPEDSGIFSYFVKAINNASDNYLNWNKFEINNISSSYYDNFVEIPFDPNSENPLFYIVYYINTSTSSGSNDYFDFAYDLFKKESKANYTVSTTNVLKIDWDSTANDNDEPLIIRSTRKIMFSIEVSSDVFENLYKNELSGSFVFVFPWLNPKDDSPIFCEFTENYYSTIDNTILNDELADRSLLILYPDLSSLESDTTNGFKDTFSCDYMTIPTAISSPKYISYITSYDGYVLSSSSVASGEYQLIPGALNLERLLVTPNNIEFPSAHYAFYFTNDIKILKDDLIGTYLSSTVFDKIPSTEITCYISYLPNSYTIPDSGASFNFDEIEYESETSSTFDSKTLEIIRLKSSECAVEVDVDNGNSLYIYLELNLDTALPTNSFFLFEVFGITNPSTSFVKISILIFRLQKSGIIENILISPSNFVHVLYDFTYDLYAEIEISSKILDTHLNGFYHIPLEIEVYFYDFLMPNFEISLKFSNNLVTSNEKNENIKLYVNMENLDTDVYYQDIVTYYYVDEDYFDYSTARLLQETSDTTNSDSTTDNTDESSNITTDSEDQNSEDDSTDSSFNVDESEDSTIVKTYRKPVIKKMRKSLDFVNFSISQPSLSQRMVTVGIYLFTLPDDDNDIDVTLTVSARDSVLIQTTQFLSYFSGTAGVLTASQLNNDVHLETQRSNFSILLKADFEIKHDYQFVMLSFTEPAMAPPELLIWINGDSMSTFIEDKFLIGALPNLAANTSFRLDISNYINNPIGIDILCYITIYAFMEDDTYIPIVAQNLLTLVASQSMDEMENILLIENANNAIYSFDSVNLEIIFKTNDIVPQKNEILRLILPLDFPPNYYIAESLVTCFLTLIDLNLNISSTCIMRGINIDLTINQNLGLTDFSGLRFLFVVSNIYSTPNFGYSGNFGLILFNILYKIRATNFKVWDYYTNPIVIQDLNSILVTLSEDSTNYEVSVEMKKGTNITIFLKTDEIGFKNEMNISLNLTGNPAITVLTPFIKINYGDFSAKFVLSATSNAILSLAYVHFTKKEKNQRQYIEIYPLAVEISLEQVEINVPKQLTMYVGGKSYFLEVKLSENINNEINVKVNTSNSNLTIIGSSELKFNSSNPNQNFRVSLKNGSNSTATYSIGYSISGVYNKLFTLSSDSTNVKVVTTKENLTSENITFSATITIQTRSINLIIKKIKNPSFIYYQVYKRLSSESLELSDLDLINKLDNQSNEKIIETNMTTGILFCEDITSTASCKVAITNLEFKQYYVKCFAISLSGIKSSTNFTMLFQPYPIKPFIMLLGVSKKLTNSNYNDLLCSLVEFFSINYNNLVLSDGTVCNISQFFSSHNTNQAFSSSSMSVSKAYIKTISSTLDEMGIKKNKLQNLASTTISNMIGNYDSLDSFIKESTQFNLKFYIYPPESDLNHDLKSYTNLIADKAKISYFKAKYFYLNYDIYLKAAGAFASDGNLQSIMPIFLGKVTIRTDNNAFSITLEVSNEAIIYGIAVQATNLIKPNGTEVALGINGDGKIAVGVDSQQTTLDNDGNIRVVTLKFSNLTNNITYTICYVAGLPIPKNRDTLVSETVYFVNATPQNPAIPSENKRILIGDEEDDA